MTRKAGKKYHRPELRVVDLTFNQNMLGVCSTPSNTFADQASPPLTCSETGCLTPP